jgi:leader peptidase (prepilin peptidase)/N-methyltransferase
MEGPGGVVVAALAGLALGSFATALSYRLPRSISMVSKAHSACPACGHDLGARDLVPVFSWLLLKGKCRYCKAPIGARYPLIELATTLLCIGIYCAYGLTIQGIVLFALAPALVAVIAIDLAHKIIPDALNLAVLALGVLALALGRPEEQDLWSALAGVALYAGAAWGMRFAFARIMKREPMGLGDVKFFGAAGFWLGSGGLEAAAQFMFLSGALGMGLAFLWRRLTGEREFPFGPALALALAAVILMSRPFLHASS